MMSINDRKTTNGDSEGVSRALSGEFEVLTNGNGHKNGLKQCAQELSSIIDFDSKFTEFEQMIGNENWQVETSDLTDIEISSFNADQGH